MADRLLGFKSAWQIGEEALGGRDSDRYGWVNRCCHYCSHLFQLKISCCWTWVVVSWSFLDLGRGFLVISRLGSWFLSHFWVCGSVGM